MHSCALNSTFHHCAFNYCSTTVFKLEYLKGTFTIHTESQASIECSQQTANDEWLWQPCSCRTRSRSPSSSSTRPREQARCSQQCTETPGFSTRCRQPRTMRYGSAASGHRLRIWTPLKQLCSVASCWRADACLCC